MKRVWASCPKDIVLLILRQHILNQPQDYFKILLFGKFVHRDFVLKENFEQSDFYFERRIRTINFTCINCDKLLRAQDKSDDDPCRCNMFTKNSFLSRIILFDVLFHPNKKKDYPNVIESHAYSLIDSYSGWSIEEKSIIKEAVRRFVYS